MAHEEAAFSSQHSAISENQPQPQNQSQNRHQKALTPEQRAQALVKRIGETCDELDKLAEENPGLVGRVARSAEEHKDAYLRLKARLALADMAPRCQWVRQDGTSCRSPQMKQHIYCFAHMQMAEARTLMLMLPAAEDANAIQVGLMQIQKALIEDRISMKKAGLLLYSMQLALTNVGQTTFGKAKDEEMVRETVDEEEALSRQRSAISQDQHQNQRPLTTKDAEDTEESGAAGHRDIGISENKDTPEGREAYESCLRMTAARVGAERKPVQPVIPPQPTQERRGSGTPVFAPGEPSETYAVLG
jgi:hypothetical protein